MVVEKNQNRSIFLATYWNLAQNSGELEIYFFEIWQILPFFPWKILCIGQNHIFRSKFGKISKKENTAPKVLALLLDTIVQKSMGLLLE